MQLIVIWHNATRTRPERTKVELEARNYILDAYVSIEKAFHDQQVHYAVAYQHPNTEWSRITSNAFNYAVRNLSDWERRNHCFTTMFIPHSMPIKRP